jgi:hypothetical protein
LIPDDQRERHGWDAAVTLVTPIERRWAVRWKRRVVLLGINHGWILDTGRRWGLGLPLPLEQSFKRFNHLHAARWSLVESLPVTSPDQPREPGRYTLLLFTSHFDFGWRRYLGTFIEATGDGLQHLWGDAPSWVSPDEGFARFEQFVDHQRVENLHLFAAYPNWACNDVRSALRRAREVASDRIDEVALAALDVTGGREARQRALDRRLQYCAGDVPPIDPDYLGIAAADLPADPYPSQGATYLLPVPLADAAEIRAAIEALPHGPDSPFARLPGTHFARLALIDDDYFAQQQARVDRFLSAYLLLSAEIDGDPGPWLDGLLDDPGVRPVIDRCWGFRYHATPAALIETCRIRPSVEYLDYPMTTVNDIFAASAAL